MVGSSVILFALVVFPFMVRAGGIVELVPGEPGPYSRGESVTVEVWLHNEDAVGYDLRLVGLDLDDAAPLVLAGGIFTHGGGVGIDYAIHAGQVIVADGTPEADARGRETLKGSEYLFLKSWGRLPRAKRLRLKEILSLNRRLNTVYWLKDFLVQIWSYHTPGWADGAVGQWCTVAQQDGHPALVRFARMLERYR